MQLISKKSTQMGEKSREFESKIAHIFDEALFVRKFWII